MTLLADAHGELVALDRRVVDMGIHATLLDEQAIAALDRERSEWRPTCPGCQQELILKRYPMRTDAYLFAHKPGEAESCHGASAGESPAHHELKLRVAGLGHRAGWTPQIEVYGDGCRADVLLSKDKERRVWEVQLSPLDTPTVIERTRRLSNSLADPVWLHQSVPMWAKSVPALMLDTDRRTVVGGIYDRTGEHLAQPISLTRAVPNVLRGALMYVHLERLGFGYWYSPRDGRPATKVPRRRVQDEPGGTVLCPSVDITTLRPSRPPVTLELEAAELGYSITEFRLALEQTHQRFRAQGYGALSTLERNILALAGEYGPVSA